MGKLSRYRGEEEREAERSGGEGETGIDMKSRIRELGNGRRDESSTMFNASCYRFSLCLRQR